MTTPADEPSNIIKLVPKAPDGDRGVVIEQIDPERTDRLVQDAKIGVAFGGATCRDYLDLLARRLEEEDKEKPERSLWFSTYEWDRACTVLERCADLAFAGLDLAARRFLAVANWRARPLVAVGLARLVDEPFTAELVTKLAADLSDSPLLIDEIRVIAGLDLRTHLLIAKLLQRDRDGDDPTPALSDCPGYVAFTEAGLTAAAARARDIHAGKLPYGSDKAFSRAESSVIARLARVALDRDEPWLPPVLDELFRKVSLAPTTAKSLPSQSVAIALGHAVEALPTPEAVATLRAVLRDLRHAGVKHKLQRNIRGAERGLAARPEIALRLASDQPISKSQLTTLARCLEGGFALGMTLEYDSWWTRLAGHPQAKTLAASLVWRLLDADGAGTAVLPTSDRGSVALSDVSGATVTAAPGCRVTLWHPSDVSPDERAAWRERIAALHIKQPFKQVFREHYVVPPEEWEGAKTAEFAGHIVSIVPLLGLARRERWRVDYDGLTRRFGAWTARLDLADEVYPGCVGATTTGPLLVSPSSSRSSSPARLGDLPPAVLSEILRAVDLLVSTSGFAVMAQETERHRGERIHQLAVSRLGAMAEMRKQALEYAFRGLDDMRDVEFDTRHLRIGRHVIHLATGRVTRDGEPIEYEPPKRSNLTAVPWLPHDEKLLEAIAYTAFDLARRQNE